MGMFAETAIVSYHLSFSDQGKQTSVFLSNCWKQTDIYRFRFPFSENKQKLPFFHYFRFPFV
jgi:hypothetical protein